MRTSVYVPDDLWTEATRADPELNASKVLQQTLRTWLNDRKPPPAFTREKPPDVLARIADVTERLLEEARETYVAGYQRGMDDAGKKLRWVHIDSLASQNWDLRAWSRKVDQADNAGFAEELLDGRLLSEYIDFDVLGIGSFPTWDAGFIDALRDVWEAVREGPRVKEAIKPHVPIPLHAHEEEDPQS